MFNPTYRRTFITPEKAAELLKKNDGNRKPSDSHISRIVADMLAGSFQLNPEPLTFSVNGTLLNGQHRLIAIIRASKKAKEHDLQFDGVEMMVSEGWPDRVMEVIDSGRKRSVSEQAHIALSLKHSDLIFGGVKLAFIIALGYSDIGGTSTANITDMMRYNYVEQNKEEMETLGMVANKYYRKNDLINPSSWMLLMLFFYRHKDERITSFIDKLADGLNISSEKDPVFQLRKYIQDRYLLRAGKKFKNLSVFYLFCAHLEKSIKNQPISKPIDLYPLPVEDIERQREIQVSVKKERDGVMEWFRANYAEPRVAELRRYCALPG